MLSPWRPRNVTQNDAIVHGEGMGTLLNQRGQMWVTLIKEWLAELFN